MPPARSHAAPCHCDTGRHFMTHSGQPYEVDCRKADASSRDLSGALLELRLSRMTKAPPGTRRIPTAPARIVLVGGGPDVLAHTEPLLPRGAYRVTFVESYEAPFARVRAERPDLVVLCLRIEDLDAFQLLSMLRLDPITRLVPVLTYTTEFEGQRFEGVDEGAVTERDGLLAPGQALARH